MNGEWVKEATTLTLVTELISCRQTFVEVSQSSWVGSFRKRWRRDHKLAKLTQTSQAIARELSIRYRGILWQMFQRIKESEPRTETEWKNSQTAIWQLVNDTTRNMWNYRRFCGAFWDICLTEFGRFGNVATLMSLRPKFMLRQFVDEMASSDSRGLLRTKAFGENEETPLVGRELLDSLDRALPVLHMQVLSKIDDLSALTDGEITADRVRVFKPPFLEYKHWLFES